ncbi:hypothetical protein M2323_003763 [Rhodoblastus acidophilus]|uniref:trypsin-like serine peptidase n=1 Tax=Rhodoblastus acidophilus TaxID=1074 RepID=UPI002224CC04|nr:serine protease [Rhodoblastus acidophilus]MCW2285926.1 hypothetical protein [Rhodoblastus acidophilus]MCW2334820.1 hypothetical protein [Rhodoblastus acidophilus]
MRLKHAVAERVLQAMEDSFDPQSMASLTFRKLGQPYHSLVNQSALWPTQVDALYQYYDYHNTIEELLVVLRDARPRIPDFALALDELGFAQIDGPEHQGRSALEALLARKQTPFKDVVAFRGQLASLEAQVCRVSTPDFLGTGALIAADLVVTNRHVIATALAADGHGLAKSVTCVFDDKIGAGISTPSCEVKVSKVEASSPHSPEDEHAGPMTSALDCLDYALLRLESTLGGKPITPNGDPRGFIGIAPPDEAPKVNSGLVILQHPGGKPMKIDIGAVTDLGVSRIRHSVNTLPGSSGAPVFDAALRFVALHHAGRETGLGESPGYNQAIPMDLILADARKKGVAI